MEHPLIVLYGDKVFDIVIEEIHRLSKVSDVSFDNKFVSLGISFLNIKAQEIVDGKEEKESLKSLIGHSFEYAAIYKYNVAGGVL